MNRYLIVDDDPAIQSLITEILSVTGDCDVVNNGEQAVECYRRSLAENRPYDMITMDIIMPVLSGFKAMQEIRSLEEDSDFDEMTKIVVISARSANPDVRNMLEDMCEAYMSKPIEGADLIQLMKDLNLIAG